jgi:general secretion pathway protein E
MTLAAASAATQETFSPPSAAFLRAVPLDYARRHLVLSEGASGTHTTTEEHLLVSDRTPASVVHNVGSLLCAKVQVRRVPAETLARLIDAAYHEHLGVGLGEASSLATAVPSTSASFDSQVAASIAASEQDLLHTEGKAALVQLVDLILFEALSHNASDVHIHPGRDCVLVRVRVDGSLRTLRTLPSSFATPIASRIKVMACLDLVERRTPQDGRASVTLGGQGDAQFRRVEIRVSTLPSTFGERVVLRLLDPSRASHIKTFAGLGMPSDLAHALTQRIDRASGIILSTGPTGSGKTTTLYTALSWLSKHHIRGAREGCELNMMTIEDPVEYDLSHGASSSLVISQTQVDPRKGLTFASGLRHILRQDPDVIMVGEIRDEETARIAVQASLTGHVVLSTLHTNDAASALARLLDLAIEPFLLATALSAVLAQRLVRTSHDACVGKGCPGCLQSGFRGRTGIFELLVVTDELRAAITRSASTDEFRREAMRSGMTPLRDAGKALVAAGVTSLAEVERVIDMDQEDNEL